MKQRDSFSDKKQVNSCYDKQSSAVTTGTNTFFLFLVRLSGQKGGKFKYMY